MGGKIVCAELDPATYQMFDAFRAMLTRKTGMAPVTDATALTALVQGAYTAMAAKGEKETKRGG